MPEPDLTSIADQIPADLLGFFSQSIDAFNSASEKLASAYAELEKRLETVNEELERTNAELKKSLIEKEKLHDQLACILESMTAAVIAVDLNETVVLFNMAAEKLIGVPSANAIGQKYNSLFADRLYLIDTLRSNQSHTRREGFIGSADQTIDPIPVEISTNLIYNNDGKVFGALEIIYDISERIKLEDQLSRSKALAELGKMAAEVAHDFRNPLGAIRLYAGMLQNELTDDRRQLADSIVRGLNFLESITYNLLSLARPIQPKFQFTDLIELVENALQLSMFAIVEKSITVEKKFDQNGRFSCFADSEQLKQIMLNLILNAIQAMAENGHLKIDLRDLAEKDQISIIVEDNGSGIPEEIRENIFTPFFSTKHTGTGLGLHTVNRIVQAHFGDISVISEKDQGTTFIVELPKDARKHQIPIFQTEIENLKPRINANERE